MEKEFVPYELAVKLKALGFDEPCFTFYASKGVLQTGLLDIQRGYLPEDLDKGIMAPTFSQAFRWFREKYGLYSWVQLHNGYIDDSFYKKLPITWTIMEHESGKQYYERDIDHNYLYHTHEEAELACLERLIDKITNKKIFDFVTDL